MKPRVTNNRVEPKTGASQSRQRVADRLGAYWSHHRVVALESLQRLLSTPVQSLLTWLVVAIAIALPATLYIALEQFETLGKKWETKPQLSAFMHLRAREDAIFKLRDNWLAKPEVSEVIYISPDDALREYSAQSGLGQVIDTLEENPLPAVLLVQPADTFSSPEQLAHLQAVLGDNTIVDVVQLDMDWVRRMHQAMVIGQRVVFALAGLLALGVLLVVGNTIRLAIENRRDEIVVVKLVGGTNAFVRRPFLYTGLWYGVGGGVIAILLLLIGVAWLAAPVQNLAGLYQSDFRLSGLGFGETLIILIGAGTLGLLGAALAVSRHLHQIEPT